MSPKRRIIPVFVPAEGCMHACVYCDQNTISGKANKATTADVREAVGSYLYNDCPAEIAFYGGSFTAIPIKRQNELLAAAQPFLSNNPARALRISTRPDCIDVETITRLKAYGVKTIEIGAQSMDEDVLEQASREHTAIDVANAASLIKQNGLSLVLQMMTGLPGDTRNKSLHTAESFIALQADAVRIYPTVIVRGTQLHDMWLRGDYHEHSVDDAVELCSEICSLFMDAGIPVIRLGLNPTELLSGGEAVAGAYHPALGELVYSRMYFEKAKSALNNMDCRNSSVTIIVPTGDMSKMVGHKRSNICELSENFNLSTVIVKESNLNQGEIVIEIN